MKKIPKGVYTKELHEQAIKLAQGEGIREAAKRLLMPHGTLKQWAYAERDGTLSEIGKSQKSLTGIELELARLKKELSQTKLERDFLKKCAAYFVKESR
jgi:transposase